MKQSDIFLGGEADAWHKRNKDKPRLPDPVVTAIETLSLKPKRVLELGCGTGWRLAELCLRLPDLYIARGYDASAEAVKDKVHPDAFHGDVSDALTHIRDNYYDMVIFGFCLYLVDRKDLMFVAANADRVLSDKGHIVIHDFCEGTYKTPYKHKSGVWSYHHRYPNLWRCNPAYKIIEDADCGDGVHVHVLEKDMAAAYPVREE